MKNVDKTNNRGRIMARGKYDKNKNKKFDKNKKPYEKPAPKPLYLNNIEDNVIMDMGIPSQFSQAVIDEIKEIVATQSNPADLLNEANREDLTHLPLVTIDGEDARDFDDAVHAYADPEPTNKGGHVLWVAIADVSHYVRQGSAIDIEAANRSTSVYFPSKVVPMLPEELSNGLCSLKPNEHRACMAYEMKVNVHGDIIGRTLHQGVMKSTARLTYTQVLAAIEGKDDPATTAVSPALLTPLYEVFKNLKKARNKRNAVEFGYGEVSIRADEKSGSIEFHHIDGDEARSLIEEAMIGANISASKDQDEVGVYRTQEKPEARKAETLKDLKKLGVASAGQIKKGDGLSQKKFSLMLLEAERCEDPFLARSMILRMQKPAKYVANNVGHFCLALKGYTHFTSPIRRYPDLLAHRALKETFNFSAASEFIDKSKLGSQLSDCSFKERRAKKASQEVNRQYMSKHFNAVQGDTLGAVVIDVSEKRGVRVLIDECKYQASIKFGNLPVGDYVISDDKKTLTNERSGHKFTIGDKLNVAFDNVLMNTEDMPEFFLTDENQALPRAGQQPKP
tara:strand:+ start:181927 stop:183621 length:1695 start_codon:yes stop_codon:yes gene_type:complete